MTIPYSAILFRFLADRQATDQETRSCTRGNSGLRAAPARYAAIHRGRSESAEPRQTRTVVRKHTPFHADSRQASPARYMPRTDRATLARNAGCGLSLESRHRSAVDTAEAAAVSLQELLRTHRLRRTPGDPSGRPVRIRRSTAVQAHHAGCTRVPCRLTATRRTPRGQSAHRSRYQNGPVAIHTAGACPGLGMTPVGTRRTSTWLEQVRSFSKLPEQTSGEHGTGWEIRTVAGSAARTTDSARKTAAGTW